jgi:hypothetical protein
LPAVGAAKSFGTYGIERSEASALMRRVQQKDTRQAMPAARYVKKSLAKDCYLCD